MRDERAVVDKERKDMTREIEERNRELTEYFEHNDLTQMRVEGAGLFFISHTSMPQIQDVEVVQQWLKDRDDLDVIMTFNQAKFKSYYNELLENNEELPPEVNQFVKTEIRMRKA